MAFINTASPGLTTGNELPTIGQKVIYSSVTPETKRLIDGSEFGIGSSDRILSPTDTIDGTINKILFGDQSVNNTVNTLPDARMEQDTPGNIDTYTREFITGLTKFPYLQIFVIVNNNIRLANGDGRNNATTKQIGLPSSIKDYVTEVGKGVGDGIRTIEGIKNNALNSVNSFFSDLGGLTSNNSIGGGDNFNAKDFDRIRNYAANTFNYSDDVTNRSSLETAIKSSVADIRRSESKLLNSFALPMPTDHTVDGSIQWSGVNAGALLGLALDDQAQAAISARMDDNSGFTSELVGKVIGRSLINASAKLFGGDENITGDQYKSLVTGQIANPRPVQVFEGTNVRSFKFTWLFAPRNYNEAKGVLGLIEKLRYYAHSDFADDTKFFIRQPAEFELEFKLPSGQTNKNIPRIRRCVMTDINVTFNDGNGRWTTFMSDATGEAGIPTHYRLTLSFSEVGVVTSSDIEAGY